MAGIRDNYGSAVDVNVPHSAPNPFPDLTPQAPGISIDRDPAGRAVGIRHPRIPYAVAKPADDAGLFAAAAAYVNAANAILLLPQKWIDALNRKVSAPGIAAQPADATLWSLVEPRWLPVNPKDPRSSFWLDRRATTKKKSTYLDRTMVLIASLSILCFMVLSGMPR
jgi:hypothetical protein